MLSILLKIRRENESMTVACQWFRNGAQNAKSSGAGDADRKQKKYDNAQHPRY
jgi:hypothetical protein